MNENTYQGHWTTRSHRMNTGRGLSLEQAALCRATSRGQSLPSSIFDIGCSIHISAHFETTLRAVVYSFAQRFGYSFPTARTVLGGVLWVDLYHTAASHHALIGRQLYQFSPAGIENAFGEVFALHHIQNV